MTTTDKIAPIHPGEILMEDFIKGFGITQSKVAAAIGVPSRRINEIVHGSAGSPRTPPHVSDATSEPRPGSGSIFRTHTTSMFLRIPSGKRSTPSSHWNPSPEGYSGGGLEGI